MVCSSVGVFQYDHGSRETNNIRVSKSSITQPPEILQNALRRLITRREQAMSEHVQILAAAMRATTKYGPKHINIPEEQKTGSMSRATII